MKVNRHKLVILIIAFLWACGMKAQETVNDSIAATERDDFVTVSLIVGSPLRAIWSTLGHATLRLQCPTHELDYVFTFESDTNVNGFMTGIAGKAQAKFVIVPAETYFDDARQMGRQLQEATINLTLNERKELWRQLDQQMMAGAYRHFNLIYTNCVLTAIQTVQSVLQNEHIEWGPTPYEMTHNDGDYFRYVLRRSPWSEFTFITFIGTAYEHHSPFEAKLSPDNILTLLGQASIVNDATGESRPALRGTPAIVLEGKPEPVETFTPLIAFALLLLLSLAVSAIGLWKHGRHIATTYDLLLFTAQTLVFLLLVFMTFYSELFPGRWNWYLLPFLPVPLLLWVLERKRNTARWWFAYSIMLAAFICATPLLGALDWPHQLITASLLVRSLNRYLLLTHKQ